MRNRILATLTLALLSPLVGEYLLGNITIRDLAALPFLMPMYGGGALLIREVTRRTGRGWPTVLVLGLAYGLIEAGVWDGSLFNPRYEGMDLGGARVPLLGLSAYFALQFIVNHAIWSITIPILLTETLIPQTRVTPWLGRLGLAVCAAGYVLGGMLIHVDSVHSGQYRTTWPQAAGAALVALVLIIVAFLLARRTPGESAGRVPAPWLVGAAAFLVSTGYFLLPANWAGVAASIGVVAAAATTVSRWSRHSGWLERHRAALAVGALMTYAWAGFLLTAIKHDLDQVALAGNGVFAVAAVVLGAVVVRRAGTQEAPRATSAAVGP